MYKLLRHAQKHKYPSLSKSSEELYGKGNYFTHVICYEENVASTLIVGSPQYHEYYPRYLSIPEVKRLQTFPDDFRLTGNYGKQWERIARSVPPRMMQALGTKIKETLEMIT